MVTVNLGAEYEQDAIEAANWVLREIGASPKNNSWALAGSQEITRFEWQRGPDALVLETETYMGLTLSGPDEIVRLVAALVKDRLAATRRP